MSIINPFWKTKTNNPYDAPTESKFITIDATGIVTDLNAKSKSKRLNNKTKPITYGNDSFTLSTESTISAVLPPT